MKLDHLTLKNYRNYATVDTAFSPEINVLIGENAQGKTNLLEAIYVFALVVILRASPVRSVAKVGRISWN